MESNKTLNIIIPVLNEEKRLENGIRGAISFLREAKIPHIISIVDNGSSDSTQEIAKSLCEEFNANALGIVSHLEYLRLEERGVGLALREAIAHNAKRSEPCGFIGYMDIDLSTDIKHLQEVYENLSKGVEIIVGSRLLKDSVVIGRSLKREILSRSLNLILKIALKAKFSDAMCGFKFYQSQVAETIKSLCNEDKSWFYDAQMLIMAQYQGIPIREIAVRWEDETTDSKVKIFSLSRIYLSEIWRLYKLLRLKNAN
nr:glycosyltransferase [uncultured Helicobacter sp.]